MDEIVNMSQEALIRYFESLRQFGYRSYSEVDKLIVLLFIEELLNGEFSFFITEEDSRVITDALYCLIGHTCLIDFPVLQEDRDTIFHTVNNNKNITYRITEGSILRSTQETILRVEA